MPKHWTLKIKGKRINMDRNLLTRWQSHIGLTNLGGERTSQELILKNKKRFAGLATKSVLWQK